MAVNGFIAAGIKANARDDNGADLRFKDNDGVTAAGWAAKNGPGNTVMILREAGQRK